MINFKGTKDLKEAIRIAAFVSGCKNSSEFMRKIITKNTVVKKELEKLINKN